MSGPSEGIRYSQSLRPSLRLKASTRKNVCFLSVDTALFPSGFSAAASGPLARVGCEPARSSPKPTCDVTHTLYSQTMGDETPSPVSGVFHATLSLLHCSGSPASVETPLPDGPLHCGQSSEAQL